MWSSLLGGNILFRWLLQQCPNCWNFQIHLRLLRWSRPGETRKGGTSPCKSALPGKIIKNLPGENLSGKIIHNPFPGKNHWESEQKMLTTPHKGVSQHCFPCILCNFPSAEVLWQVIRKFTDSQCYIFLNFQYVGYIVKIQNDVGFSLVINSFCKWHRGSVRAFNLQERSKKICQSRNLHNLHFPDNTFQGRICLQRELVDFLGPGTHQVFSSPTFTEHLDLIFAPSPNLSLMKNLQENVKQRLLTGMTSAIFFIYVLGFKFKVELKYL